MVVEHVAVEPTDHVRTGEVADRVLPEVDGLPPVPDDVTPIEQPARRSAWRRAVMVAAASWGAPGGPPATMPALLFVYWSKNINVDPLTRIGQVSGLATLQFRFALIAIVLVAGLLAVHRFAPAAWHEAATRVACAVVAGLATALVGGGAAIALRHTPWALWANGGDNHWIMDWVHTLLSGKSIPKYYPPMPIWTIAGWSKLSGKPPEYAYQDIQLVGATMYGPAAYLAWRMMLRPLWALGIGVVACVPFIEPVKPYTQITLVMMIPVLVKLLHTIRYAGKLSLRRAALMGAALGGGLGLLFLLYSGWFVWAALGVFAAVCVVTPWRTALWRAALVAATALVTFVAVSWVHLSGILSNNGGTSDSFFYFDTNTEPTYIAMWRNDRGLGAGPVWPPLGELGGVGLFTILLVVGMGVALWFGWRRTVVLGLGLVIVSAWLMRMYLASQQYATHTVRLYPRTTMIILHCLLLLTGFAIFYAVRWIRDRPQQRLPQRLFAVPPVGLLLIPLLFFFASAGSATADKFMPQQPEASFGYFTWIAQAKRNLDGSCNKYAVAHKIGCARARTPTGASATPTPGASATPTPKASATTKPSGAKPSVTPSR
jgi:galactan 5-O-arabinofuranosyltransferase